MHTSLTYVLRFDKTRRITVQAYDQPIIKLELTRITSDAALT